MDENLIQVCIGAELSFEFIRPSHRNELSHMHESHNITELVCFVHVVCRHQNRRAEFLPQYSDPFPHGDSCSRIQPYRRLVKEEHIRTMQHCLRNLQPSDHASRILADQSVCLIAKLNEFERAFYPFGSEFLGDALELGRDEQIFITCEFAVSRKHLGHIAYMSSDFLWLVRDVKSGYARASRCRRK